MDIIARLTTGRPWPDGAPATSGSAVIAVLEDHHARVVRPRLEVAGANLDRVFVWDGVEQNGELLAEIPLLTDVAALEATLDDNPDIRLVVFDPLGDFLPPRVDAYRETDVRGVLRPLQKLAAKRNIAVVLIAHRGKMINPMGADESVLGSRAFTGLVRAVWHVREERESDGEDDGWRLLLPGKNNWAKSPGGLKFCIDGMPARVIWADTTVNVTADEFERQREHRHQRQGAVADAQAFLEEQLAAGPQRQDRLLSDWLAAGGSRATLYRARDLLGIESIRLDSTLWWQLPTVSPEVG